MKKFTKAQMKRIKALAKKYSVDLHEAARMYVRAGI